jgi:hypothetical protein
MTSLADQESAVQDFCYALQQHQRNCERLGRYTEAEIAKARLAELKQHEESRRRETLRARQLAEVLAVEEAHMMVRCHGCGCGCGRGRAARGARDAGFLRSQVQAAQFWLSERGGYAVPFWQIASRVLTRLRNPSSLPSSHPQFPAGVPAV